jgi:hypothetical protein
MESTRMKLRKLLIASTAIAASTLAPAQAAVVDNPHFKVLGLVIVWGADGFNGTGTAPVVSDFVIDTGAGTTAATSGDADLIASDVYTVVTGSLAPTSDAVPDAAIFSVDGTSVDLNSDGVMDATDGFAAFALTGTTDVGVANAVSESSFYVASNTAFGIDATATAATAVNFDLADVGVEMSVTQSGNDGLAFGSAAQLPHSAGATGGVNPAVATLADLATTPDLFRGNRRTAATVGSIAAQSVRFDVTYTLGGTAGYDLSMGAGEIEANVTYTVFVP